MEDINGKKKRSFCCLFLFERCSLTPEFNLPFIPAGSWQDVYASVDWGEIRLSNKTSQPCDCTQTQPHTDMSLLVLRDASRRFIHLSFTHVQLHCYLACWKNKRRNSLVGKQWNELSWSDSQHKQTDAQMHYPLGLMQWTRHLVFNNNINLLTMILINNTQHTFPDSLNGNYHTSLSQKCHRQKDCRRVKMVLDSVIIQCTFEWPQSIKSLWGKSHNLNSFFMQYRCTECQVKC